jgi:cardiolipin synthase (CMP-forming)
VGTVVKTGLTCLVMSTGPDVTSLNMRTIRSGVAARRVNPLRTAPNLLTMLRVCLTPFLVIAVLERRFLSAFVIFLMAACSDAMDGLLARWLRQRTMLGQYLDPVADKLLLSSLFLVFTYMGILEPRIAVLVFGRDLGMLLTAVILYATTNLRDFRPSLLGKANSFSQFLAIGVVLLSLISQQPWVAAARVAMLDATVFLTVVSGFHYAWVASQRIGVATDSDAVSLRNSRQG